MGKILGGWISILVGLIGLWVSLNLDVSKFSTIQIVLLTIAAIGILFMIVLDIYSHLQKRPKFYSNSKQIDNYMYNWISQRGRIMIFTRDMSWANSEKMNNLLITKARCGELEICLPKAISLTNSLSKQGAKIHTYESFNDAPHSRFTIVRYGKEDARVAIGRHINGVHRIEEYSYGSDPTFSIANDLVRIIKHYSP